MIVSLRLRGALLFLSAILGFGPTGAARSDVPPEVDTALVLAVDVSDSVDAARYQLQMEGIARALEDESVINAITGGPKGGILLSLISWADHAQLQLP